MCPRLLTTEVDQASVEFDACAHEVMSSICIWAELEDAKVSEELRVVILHFPCTSTIRGIECFVVVVRSQANPADIVIGAHQSPVAKQVRHGVATVTEAVVVGP